MTTKIKIGVLISGGGSNLQAILDATCGELAFAQVARVISNKKEAFGLERAKKSGVPATFLDPKDFPSRAAYFEKIAEILSEDGTDLVCLAGFLLKLEPPILQRFKERILNIHPGPLPKFGGKGMYGHFVHEAVLAAGLGATACTVHVVDEEFDHGPVIAQTVVPVLPGDSAEALAERVLKEEHILYPQAIAIYCKKKFPGRVPG